MAAKLSSSAKTIGFKILKNLLALLCSITFFLLLFTSKRFLDYTTTIIDDHKDVRS